MFSAVSGQCRAARVYRVIRKGEVRVNGRRAGPETRLQLNDRIRIPPVRVLPPAQSGRPSAQLCESIGKAVIYQDEKLLVLDKPAGVAVHGGSGVSFGVIEALRALRPDESLELVHRLDRDTSGCLLIAREAATLRSLHALLRTDGFEKRYLALVRGKWELGAKRIDVPLRTDTRVGGERTVRAGASGKPSVSEFRPVQFFGRTGRWWKSRCARAALIRFACTRSTPDTRWRGMKSTAMPRSTTSCVRSASAACSCTRTASASRGRRAGSSASIHRCRRSWPRCSMSWHRGTPQRAVGSGQVVTGAAQRPREPDERQPDESRRILALDALEQRNT